MITEVHEDNNNKVAVVVRGIIELDEMGAIHGVSQEVVHMLLGTQEIEHWTQEMVTLKVLRLIREIIVHKMTVKMNGIQSTVVVIEEETAHVPVSGVIRTETAQGKNDKVHGLQSPSFHRAHGLQSPLSGLKIMLQ